MHIRTKILVCWRPHRKDVCIGLTLECGYSMAQPQDKREDKTVRRLKTYAGAQGYVYQYYFVGRRLALTSDPEAPAVEFIFDVTSDRKLIYAVSIFLKQTTINSWAASHGRPLTETEEYAAAKLRLFRAFDELADLQSSGRRLVIETAALEESLASLGIE
jgi:hypothetical protein